MKYLDLWFVKSLPWLVIEIHGSKKYFYRNIFLSQYCAPKCLVWIRSNEHVLQSVIRIFMNKAGRLFLGRFWPLLNQAVFMEAAGAVLKIENQTTIGKFSLPKSVKRSVLLLNGKWYPGKSTYFKPRFHITFMHKGLVWKYLRWFPYTHMN